MNARYVSSLAASMVLSLSAAAAAQPEGEPAPAEPAPTEDAAAAEDAPPTEDAVPAEEVALEETPSEEAPPPAGEPTEAQQDAMADAKTGNSPVELPGEVYHFVGARYRLIVVPQFMVNLFADGGATEAVHAFGAEYANRKDGFEYNVGAWLGLYHQDPTPYKGKNDDVDAWELIESELKVFYLTSDFLWSHEFSPEFALNYGLGAGFGFVFGNLHRDQAFPSNPGNIGDLPDGLIKCQSPDQPGDALDYCGDDNDHYGDYTEPSWAGGGSKPIIMPWLAFQTGFRYKPTKHFASRLDLGFGTSGFFVGLGLDYGI